MRSAVPRRLADIGEKIQPTLEGPSLSDKPASNRQEEEFLTRAKEALLSDFPNPGRKGCPDSETLRAIALGRIKGEKASRWRVHAATCSPCTREYVNFRTEAEWTKRLRTLAAIAAAIIFAVFAGWFALSNFGSRRQSWQQAKLDLRGHEPLRGSERTQPAPLLLLPRGKLDLSIDLPVGSEAGDYDVQVVRGSGQPVKAASGRAELVNGVTVLRIRLDLRRAAQGPASLLVRRSGQSLTQYGVVLK